MYADLFDDFVETDTTFDRITLWDYSGRGDYLILAAVRTSAAVTI